MGEAQAAGALVAVAWVLAGPGLQLYVVNSAWRMELVRDRVLLRRFGWLLAPYEQRRHWWEAAVLLRKVALVAAQVCPAPFSPPTHNTPSV